IERGLKTALGAGSANAVAKQGRRGPRGSAFAPSWRHAAPRGFGIRGTIPSASVNGYRFLPGTGTGFWRARPRNPHPERTRAGRPQPVSMADTKHALLERRRRGLLAQRAGGAVAPGGRPSRRWTTADRFAIRLGTAWGRARLRGAAESAADAAGRLGAACPRRRRRVLPCHA